MRVCVIEKEFLSHECYILLYGLYIYMQSIEMLQFRAIGPSCVFCMLIVYELKLSSFFPSSALLHGSSGCLSVRRAQ